METKENSNPICKNIPNLLSSFVDTFVDFTVSGGIFLPQTDKLEESKKTYYPSQKRLIAVGDLHGDLEKTKQSFKLAGLIDESDEWSGGSSTVVQIGDVLDRGGEELKILYFLEKLKREALINGGNLITMNGNHEIMNVEFDFRYVTKIGLDEFVNWAHWYSIGNRMKSLCLGSDKFKDIFEGIPMSFRGVREEFWHGIRARIAAFRPNGPIANKFLSNNVTVVVVGDSVFVHGGLLAQHVEYGLERMNREVRDWISGLAEKSAPSYCKGREAVVWLRKFSDELVKNCDCAALEHALATIPGVKRMIMGHTIQEAGINAVCNDKAIRIDVGMSKGCINGLPEVLEITGRSEVRILTSNSLYQTRHDNYADSDRKAGLGLLLQENTPKQVKVKA